MKFLLKLLGYATFIIFLVLILSFRTVAGPIAPGFDLFGFSDGLITIDLP